MASSFSSRARVRSSSSARRIGSPALIRVRNCWLKTRNLSSATLRRRSPHPRCCRTVCTSRPWARKRSRTSRSLSARSVWRRRWPRSLSAVMTKVGMQKLRWELRVAPIVAATLVPGGEEGGRGGGVKKGRKKKGEKEKRKGGAGGTRHGDAEVGAGGERGGGGGEAFRKNRE